MKLNIVLAFLGLHLLASAQTKTMPVEGGLSFTMNIPAYLSKTAGINTAAALQFKSVVKDIYGIVIYDTKEELLALEMKFNNAQDFTIILLRTL